MWIDVYIVATDVYIVSSQCTVCAVCVAKIDTEDRGKNTTTPETQRERHNCKKEKPKDRKKSQKGDVREQKTRKKDRHLC